VLSISVKAFPLIHLFPENSRCLKANMGASFLLLLSPVKKDRRSLHILFFYSYSYFLCVPQAIMCNLHAIQYDYIGHMESLEADVKAITGHLRLPRAASEAAHTFFATKSVHSTNADARTREMFQSEVLPKGELDSTRLLSPLLYCTALYSTVQYSTVQYSTEQYSAVQHCSVQYSTVQHSTVMYSPVQYSNVQYSAVQHCTAQYCTLLYSKVLCSTQKLCLVSVPRSLTAALQEHC